MKTEKTMYRFFSYRDRMRIVQFLEDQAFEGWLFSGFKKAGWGFRRIEPQEMHFSVVYFPDVSEYDATPTPELIEFRRFCDHSGWKFVDSSEKMQIFRNESENPVPIETEPLIELENIHRIEMKRMKKNFMNSLLFLVLWLLIGFAAYRRAPVRCLLNPIILFYPVLWGADCVLTLIHFAEYIVWYFKARHYALECNDLLNDRYAAPISVILRSLLFIALFVMLLFYRGWRILFTALLFLIVSLAILFPIFRLIKNQMYNRTKNMLILFGCSIVVIFVISGLFTAGINLLDVELDLYAPIGSAWAKYEEAPPLSTEEFYGEKVEQTRYSSSVKETVFLTEYRAWIYAEQSDEWMDLDYTVLKVKWDALYETCLTEYLNYEYFTVDAVNWGAVRAYRYGNSDAPKCVWLLCYADRIIQISVSEEPTAEQMALIAQKLGSIG